MANSNSKPDRALLLLGAAIAFPMILASGPIAGFVIGQYILVKYLGAPPISVPILVALGFAASGMQCYQLLKIIKTSDAGKH